MSQPLCEDPLKDALAEEEDTGARLTTLLARLGLVVRDDADSKKAVKGKRSVSLQLTDFTTLN